MNNEKMSLTSLCKKMNDLGKKRTPFLIITDFSGVQCRLWKLDELPVELQLQFPSFCSTRDSSAEAGEELSLHPSPVSFKTYDKAFTNVANHLHRGDTYLVNLTMPTPIEISLTPEMIFRNSSAKYRVMLENEFLFYSPETFVQISQNRISSFPMKGTIPAHIPNAESIILNDPKETAEHNTIVDLIRNDLSIISKKVSVPRFRFIDKVTTHKGDLLQVSSEVCGELEENWQERVGDILTSLLPAGSISGAPKEKTVEIIRESEPDDRGYYTGVTALFDGENLDSCVNIRYIEIDDEQLIYRSGGGITAQSSAEAEYRELLEKIYVPTR